MEHKVNGGVWGTMFGVPYVVADNFLKLATGGQIKVLLYILRASGRAITSEEIAANTGVTAAEADEAVAFWRQANVLSPVNSEVQTVPTLMAPPADEPSTEEVPKEKTVTVKQSSSKHINMSSSEIADMIKGSQDISELFSVAEKVLGLLNHAMQNSLIWMYTYLGLKKEVIITLVSYCSRIAKATPQYIEKIAASWAENDINSLETAAEEVQRMTFSREFDGQIMKTFQMKRRPTEGQTAFIREWQRLEIPMELLHYAFEKCIENTEKLSFSYINKIVISWKERGYRSVDEVKAAEKDFRSKKAAAASGSTDLSKYEQLINKF